MNNMFLRAILSTPAFGFLTGIAYIVARTNNKEQIPKDYSDKDLLKLFFAFDDVVATFILIIPFLFISFGLTNIGMASIFIGYILSFIIGVHALIKARTAEDKNLKYLVNGVVGALVFIMSWIPMILTGIMIYAWSQGIKLF